MTSYDVCSCISPSLVPRLSLHANEKRFSVLQAMESWAGLRNEATFHPVWSLSTYVCTCTTLYVPTVGSLWSWYQQLFLDLPLFITYSCNDCSVFNMHVAMDQELDGRKDPKRSCYDNYKELQLIFHSQWEWASILSTKCLYFLAVVTLAIWLMPHKTCSLALTIAYYITSPYCKWLKN